MPSEMVKFTKELALLKADGSMSVTVYVISSTVIVEGIVTSFSLVTPFASEADLVPVA